MAITRLPWVGEARRLSVEPRGQVGTQTLNDYKGSVTHDNKADIKYITGRVYFHVFKLRYYKHLSQGYYMQSLALGHIQIQIHQYKCTVPKIKQFTQIKYNHSSKRGYLERGKNTRLKYPKTPQFPEISNMHARAQAIPIIIRERGFYLKERK